MKTFGIKNWQKFQHYKKRTPPWIKLYTELLNDYDFARLPDANKAHLIGIWLLASRLNNVVPFDPAWVAAKINATMPIDLTVLEAAGFIYTHQEDTNVVRMR